MGQSFESKKVLWDKLAAWMQQRYGREHLSRCSRAAGIGLATMSRLKGQETSIGPEVIDKLAALIRLPAISIAPTQILRPNCYRCYLR